MRNIILAAFAASSLVCQSAEIKFSYDTDNSSGKWFGYDKAETYDVAILIDNPYLVGSAVTGLEVPVISGGTLADVSGWLSSDLILKKVNGKNVNSPDICTQPGSVSGDVLTVTFDSPYVIDGPLYVGYSFTVSEAGGPDGKPVALADGDAAGGLYLHSSRSKLKWGDMVSQAGGVSGMKVVISGDFHDNSAVIEAKGIISAAVDTENISIPATLVNHGLNAISSVEYTWSIGGHEGTEIIEPAAPLPAVWGAGLPIEFAVPQIGECGSHEAVVNVTKVNGVPNTSSITETVIQVRVYPFIPVSRPLVEEYTGLWCGACPSGYVAMETLHEQNPETFIGLAYHEGDPMAFDTDDWPAYPGSYPTVYINRGNKMSPPELYKAWPNYASMTAVAAVDVDVEWDDEDETVVKAVSKVCFTEDYSNADFAMSYALVADGLSDPSWHQSNAYAGTYDENAGENHEMPGELGEIFTKGGNPIDGLIYNDVALTLLKPNGFDGSIPKKIEMFEEYRHVCKISLDDLHRKLKDLAKGNRDKLRVVAILMDRKTERPANCNTSGYIGSSGIEDVTCGMAPQKTVWHNIQGMKVDDPRNGIYIRTDIMSDGSIRTSKQYVK